MKSDDVYGMASLRQEIEQAQRQLLLLSDSPMMRMVKEIQETYRYQQEMLTLTVSPLKDELERYRKMVVEASALTSPIANQVRREALLNGRRVSTDAKPLPRAANGIDLCSPAQPKVSRRRDDDQWAFHDAVFRLC
jgi:hypothetical protein